MCGQLPLQAGSVFPETSASCPLAAVPVLGPGVPVGLLSPGTARRVPLSEGCGAYRVSPWPEPKFVFATLFPSALENKP